ncbi:DUF2721 domain-containing protein [Tabrizicola sp. J26]|uniref:DUF2721 domain-containing protein n=1 Tax=Alitabrizicola rongguiensis TaxID=2909234 RepID=UPI001F39A3C6|nr:DUF2721 domain-containing protein [Tabrizicola rongguiensis]MCF1708445.1 DUF2721 domain-containing protein [Tabrizicola rongguiensis]
MDSVVQHLSEAITHAAAPAFFLGAVTGLLSVVLTRLSGVMAEFADVSRKGKAATPRGRRLLRRARLLHSAVSFAVAAGISTTTLLAVTFLAAFVHMPHLYVAGLLFVGATTLTGFALVRFYQEVRFELLVVKEEIDRSGGPIDAEPTEDEAPTKAHTQP